MRVIDEITEQEIFDEPDLTVGELFYNPSWVSKAAYDRAEAEGLPAVLDSDYEEVLLYHVWTEEEKAERDKKERERVEAEGRNAMLLALSEAFTETFEPSDKQGFLWKVVKLGEVEIMREYVTDPDYDPDGEDGSYLKPFTFTAPMEVVEGKFYTDGEDVWECVQAGTAEAFTAPWFDVIEV